MTPIGLLFGFLGLGKVPRWLQELLIILAALGALWAALAWHDHKVYRAGIAAQRQADAAASAKLIADAAVATKAAQDAANRAEESYREEIARNAAAAAARPLGPVRLCLDPYAGGRGLPEAAAAVSGASRAGPAAGGVPQMPAGDPGLRSRAGPDLSGLLDLLARRGDGVSAALRECKSR